MQIFATFEYSAVLEMVISELEVNGITRIYAVPLDLRKKEPRLMDSLHRADGLSFLDKGMVLGFMFATFGASKGFVWEWGPVIWGLIGAVIGILLGIVINWSIYFFKRHKNQMEIKKGKKGDVVLIITCEEGQVSVVTDILWDHKALGLAKTK